MNDPSTTPLPRAPRPADEAIRLRTLEALDVLDTLPETFSDAVVMAAASIANTPMAVLSLVADERQWFKAQHGMTMAGTDRETALCAHTVCGQAPLVVADATADARFADNPMVVGPPYIRFYAGFPLVVSGQAVGTLCVIADLPRTLDAEQLARLDRLSKGAAAWLQLRAERIDGDRA